MNPIVLAQDIFLIEFNYHSEELYNILLQNYQQYLPLINSFIHLPQLEIKVRKGQIVSQTSDGTQKRRSTYESRRRQGRCRGFTHLLMYEHIKVNKKIIIYNHTKLFQVAGAMMKQIGSKIAKGDFNLATIPKPICLTAPITCNECLLFDFDYTNLYLTEAAKCRDALRRMQLVVINEIAYLHGTHTYLRSLAPIDPMIGETCHRIKEDGTEFYCEFIKADPPTTLYHVIGDGWQVYGGEEVLAEIHPTCSQLIGRNLKPKYIKFSDGKLYEISVPAMIINGLLKGDRVLNKLDGFVIKCVKDNLEAQISFSYVYEDSTTKIKNKLMFWSQSQQKPISDLVDVKINKLINTDDNNNNQSFTVSTGSGSWLSYFQIDGDVCWRIDDPISPWKEPSNMIPSDSAFRQDKILQILYLFIYLSFSFSFSFSQQNNIRSFKLYNIFNCIILMLQGQDEAAQIARNIIEKQGQKDLNQRKRRR